MIRRWALAHEVVPLAAAGAMVLVLAVPAPAQVSARQVLPGDPLPGLTPVELEEFMLGLEDFLEVEDADEGLGPAYNNTSCAGCHNVPAIGGIAPMTTTRAGVRESDGTYRDIEPGRGVAVPDLLDPDARLPVRHPRRRRTSSSSVSRSPCSAPA